MTSDPDQHSTPSGIRLLSPLRDFLHTETSGAALLIVGALAALLWANSPWSATYEQFWATLSEISVGSWSLHLSLRHLVNDGLMAVFFFVVGLEIKRELTTGHLTTKRQLLRPAAAALGGMAVPALVYLAIAGRTAFHGWAVPVATDIALALGVLALAGSAVSASMRAFMLGLAIIDDIGAIIIIAVVYSTGVSGKYLLLALVAVVAAVILRRVGIRVLPMYVCLAILAWYWLYRGGIHPTLAGVAMGLLVPTEAHVPPEFVDSDELEDLSTVQAARATSAIARNSVSEVEWLQHVLHPWTSFVIVPIFALANSGVEVTGSGLRHLLTSALAWGIIAGLVLGKPLGVLVALALARRAAGGASTAESNQAAADNADNEHTFGQTLGLGTAAGIGFTIALFITDLAFQDPAQRADAKLAVLIASIVAGMAALTILRAQRPEVND